MSKLTVRRAVRRAIEAYGSQTALAEAVQAHAKRVGLKTRCGQSTVQMWLQRGAVAPTFAPLIEAVSSVPAEDTCPEFDWQTIRNATRA